MKRVLSIVIASGALLASTEALADTPGAAQPASSGATSPVLPPPPSATIAPSAQVVPAAAAPTDGKRRGSPLMTAGFVMMSVGVVVSITGLVLVAVSSKADVCYRNSGRYGSGSYDSYGCEDKGLKTSGLVALAGGALLASTGLVLTIVGASRRTASSDGATRVGIAPHPGGLSVLGTF